MTSDTLTSADRIELIKLLKSLAMKSAQVIVQSRDGNKVQANCNPNVSGYATFNLAIRELVEVDREVKRVMNGAPMERWSMCIDIFVHTHEGDEMVLETWNISMTSDYCDSTTSYEVYNRLGILLKSLLTITRIVPAYKYSRRQSAETYHIGYTMYSGEMRSGVLGDKYKKLKVGSVSTPIGTLHLVCHYRNDMHISPQPSVGGSLVLKSDHFVTDIGPKCNREQASDDESWSDMSNCKIGAFVDSHQASIIPDGYVVPELNSKLLDYCKSRQSPSGVAIEKVTQFADEQEEETKQLEKPEKIAIEDKSDGEDFELVLKPVPFVETTNNMELANFYHMVSQTPKLKSNADVMKVKDRVGDLDELLADCEAKVKNVNALLESMTIAKDDDEEAEETESAPLFSFQR